MKAGNEAMNLSVNARLKRLFKVQCAIDGKGMAEVTEELYVKFLEAKGVRINEDSGTYGKGKRKK